MNWVKKNFDETNTNLEEEILQAIRVGALGIKHQFSPALLYPSIISSVLFHKPLSIVFGHLRAQQLV